MSRNPTPQFCGHCGAPLQPGATFCGRCGTPVPGAVRQSTFAPAAAVAAPAYAGAPAGYAPAPHSQVMQALPSKSRGLSPWLIVGGAVLLGIIILGVVAYLLRPTPAVCTEGCGPPSQPALQAQHRYESFTYHYSLQWNEITDATIVQTHADDKSIGFSLKENPNYSWEFTAEPANGRSEQQIVESLASSHLPGAQQIFTIPGAEVGYQPGFGNVYDLQAIPGTGQQIHLRGFVLAAIRNGLAVEVIAYGPYKNTGWNHANPAESAAPFLFDPPMNTVRWQGEPQL